MSAEAYREEEMYREAEPDLINIKRNPYLVDYEQQRRLREHREQRISPEQEKQRLYQRTQRISQRAQEQELQRVSHRASQDGQELQRVPRRVSQGGQRSQREQELQRVPRRASQSEERFQREQEDRRVTPAGRTEGTPQGFTERRENPVGPGRAELSEVVSKGTGGADDISESTADTGESSSEGEGKAGRHGTVSGQ